MIASAVEEGRMASATLREIFADPTAHRPSPTALAPTALAPAIDEYAWIDEDPDLAPYLAGSGWKPRKETPLDAFL